MILFILSFFIIFGPLLDIGMGLFSDVIIFLSLLLSLYVLGYKKRKIDKEIKKYIYISLAIILYSILTFIIFNLAHPEESIRVLLRPIRIIITFLGIYSLVLLYIDKYGVQYINKILAHVYYSIAIHALIMVYQFIDPSFRNFIYSFTTAKYVLESNQLYRMAGLSGGGGAMISVFQSMGLLILPFLIKTEKKFFKKIIIIIFSMVIILSIILSGRSGMVTFAIFLPIIGIYFFIQSNILIKLKYLAIYFFSIIVIVFSFIWIYQNMLDELDPYAKRAFERTFESVITYSQTNKVQDQTVSALQNMLVLPDSPLQFFFGELHYLGGYRGVQSDIGYIRYIYGYGVFGSILNYAFYIYALIYLYRNRKAYKDFSFLTSILLLTIMFFQMKEIFIFTKTGFSITSLMLIAYIMYLKTDRGRYRYGLPNKTNK